MLIKKTCKSCGDDCKVVTVVNYWNNCKFSWIYWNFVVIFVEIIRNFVEIIENFVAKRYIKFDLQRVSNFHLIHNDIIKLFAKN